MFDKRRKSMFKNLIENAKDLLSDDGENPEYDRAIVELVSRTTHMPVEKVKKLLGVNDNNITRYDNIIMLGESMAD
jgi:hypothetical protein